ncbi:MAG: hypothetical protein ACTHQQ_08020 [Solirubrobacteraceae bacterium]
MTALVVVLITIGVLGLGALEIWLFWMLGAGNDRDRRGRASTGRLPASSSERRRGEHDRIAVPRDPQKVHGRERVGKRRTDAGQRSQLRSTR